MEEEHRRAIQQNFTSLVAQTDLDSMVSILFEKNVFSERMIEPYKDTSKDVRTRKWELYMDIMRRGPNAFRHLVDALSELGHWDLARDLDPDSPLHPYATMSRSGTQSRSNDFLSIRDMKRKNELEKKDTLVAPAPEPSNRMNAPTEISTDIPHFNVIKSTKFFEDSDNEKGVKLYRTRGRKRGALVVFSYTEFKYNIEPARGGADVDCKNLKYLFGEFGFSVVSYNNHTKQGTLDKIKSLKSEWVDVECLFIVISSHGHERSHTSDVDFRCSDGGLLSDREVIELFNNKNFPQLNGIPKVFIFQICRGMQEDYDWMGSGSSKDGVGRGGVIPPVLETPHPSVDLALTASVSSKALSPATGQSVAAKNRAYSDILIAHSTIPGHVSYRDPQKGSWYIQALCDVFAARAHDTHVEELFTLVDDQLHRDFQGQTSSVDKWGFNGRLYLHPGLFED